MSTSYTEEAKFALLDTGSQNWGAVINGITEALDAGAELTFVFGENVSAGDAVALKTVDGLVYKAASNDSTLTPAIGFAPNTVVSGNQGKVRWFGWIDVDTSFASDDEVSWSPGDPVYVGSVAGRLAKSRYSWANPIGWAKSFTTDGFISRIAINPRHRHSEIVEDLTSNKKIVFVKEVDNGDSGAAAAIDWNEGNKQKIVLTDDCSLTFATPFGVTTVTLKVEQDVAGSRLVTWPANVKWSSGTAPTLTTTGNAIDIVVFYCDGVNYYGSSALDFS